MGARGDPSRKRRDVPRTEATEGLVCQRGMTPRGRQADCLRTARDSHARRGADLSVRCVTRHDERVWRACRGMMNHCRGDAVNARSHARKPSSRATTGRQLVLVVEDDDDARTIYAATLEHAGYEVVCART